jgi:hypothetical protein
MTTQQKLLWEKLTKEVRESGMDNLHARVIYDELSKLLNMKDKTLISIIEKDKGLEVRIHEEGYGNLALIGLLEKVKLNLLDSFAENKEEAKEEETKINKQRYDA